MTYNPSNGGMFSSIANLNSNPTEYDLVLQQQQDGYDDLDMFMNTQLFDFDMGTVTENNSPSTTHFGDNNNSNMLGMMDMKLNTANQQQQHQQPGYSAVHPDFNVPFATIPITNNIAPSQQHKQQSQQQQQQRPGSIPLHLQSHIFPQIAPALPANTNTSSAVSSPAITDLKRPATAMDNASSPSVEPNPNEDPSHAAAEEDKRRRNTAASARFRVKKKQREAALEKSAKEMSEKLRYLESRVGTLEMENKLLKELVTEKRGAKEVEVVERTVAETNAKR